MSKLELIDIYIRIRLGHDIFHKEKTEYIYIILNEISKLTKVGITTDFYQRLNNLNTCSGITLQPIFFIELEDDEIQAKWIEKLIFDYFKDKREIGEWFNFNYKDVKELMDFLHIIDGEYIEYFIEEEQLLKLYTNE